jgi:Helicase conserved C-terminal domain
MLATTVVGMPGMSAEATTGAKDRRRSLADELRQRSDDDLAALLWARPDLATPIPADMSQLASRATTRASLQRAIDRLDRFELQVLEALAVMPEPTTYADVRRLLGADDELLRPVLDRIRRQALVWDDDDRLRLARSVRELLGPHAADLGPPVEQLLAGYSAARIRHVLADLGLSAAENGAPGVHLLARALADDAFLARLLAEAPEPAREVVSRLAAGPPVGTVEDARRDISIATASTPIGWLLARGLLVATDPTTVVLPREVALHLRGGHLHAQLETSPPSLPTVERDPALVERTAAGSAFAFVRRIVELLDAWSVAGPPVLRSGGLGVRELRRVAAAVDVDEATAALLVEVASAAGLIGSSGERFVAEGDWLPTSVYDSWRARDPAEQWTLLARAWLSTTRTPGLVGTRDDRDRVVNALSAELDRGVTPEVRRAVLEELAALPPGAVPAPEALSARLSWRRPRRASRLRRDLVDWTMREAEQLGVTGLGALASYARSLLEGSDRVAGELAPLLPEPLDHVLLQADLTAIAPGPLETGLAAELGLAADVESTGGATVYRFSESSIRRALDAGRSAADLHALLATRSRTPVPQPLTYLVDDMARRHGKIRVSTATAVIRADDENVLEQILADRRAAQLRLRRLAPTVLAGRAKVDHVLEQLRAMGYAPVAESPDGEVVIRRPDARRAPQSYRSPRLGGEPTVPPDGVLDVVLRALRTGDRAAAAAREATPVAPLDSSIGRSPAWQTMAALTQALRTPGPLWIGYVDNSGTVTERLVDPVRLDGGYLTAYDHRREEIRTFAVHRITGVATVDVSEPGAPPA